MRSTGLAIVLIKVVYELSIGTNIGDFEWPWMTLNGEMALILYYFTEFLYDVVVKQLLVLSRFQNLRLIVYHHTNTVCPLIRRLFRQNKLW